MHIDPALTVNLAWLLPGIFLYVEMHYRWWPLPSRYFRREPEILADAPHRLEPGCDLPLLLLIKDAQRYPIHLEKVTLAIEQNGNSTTLPDIVIGEDIAQPWWYRSVPLACPSAGGNLKLWATFHYTVRGKSRTCIGHNLPTLKSRPLTIHRAERPLPGNQVIWGDMHHHSSYTEDMIEFGAPLAATAVAAQALGLGFVCATDHSYDLDDRSGSWTQADPQLTRWHASRREIAAFNCANNDVFMIPGEEVSTRNTLGQTIHTLVLNHPHFLPGSGDSGERLFHRRSELDLDRLTAQLDRDAFAVAAHPFCPIPFLQRALIGRGTWQARDVSHPKVTGLQILNGSLDDGFFRGVEAWKLLLLAGRHTYIYAGTDSHGDFNRQRQLGLPFISIRERRAHLLGSCRTGVLDAPSGDMAALLTALRAGRCIITTGPFVDLRLSSDSAAARIGESIRGNRVTAKLTLASTPEFGPLARFRLIQGPIGATGEDVLHEIPLEHSYDWTWEKTLDAPPGASYLRAEVESLLPEWAQQGDRTTTLAMTNPIWVEKG